MMRKEKVLLRGTGVRTQRSKTVITHTFSLPLSLPLSLPPSLTHSATNRGLGVMNDKCSLPQILYELHDDQPHFLFLLISGVVVTSTGLAFDLAGVLLLLLLFI